MCVCVSHFIGSNHCLLTTPSRSGLYCCPRNCLKKLQLREHTHLTNDNKQEQKQKHTTDQIRSLMASGGVGADSEHTAYVLHTVSTSPAANFEGIEVGEAFIKKYFTTSCACFCSQASVIMLHKPLPHQREVNTLLNTQGPFIISLWNHDMQVVLFMHKHNKAVHILDDVFHVVFFY